MYIISRKLHHFERYKLGLKVIHRTMQEDYIISYPLPNCITHNIHL